MVRLGTTSSSTSDHVEGGDGGSYTYAGSYSRAWSDTTLSTSVVQSLTFNDFADSSGVDIYYSEGSDGGIIDARMLSKAVPLRSIGGIYFRDLQAGQGTMYTSHSQGITTDGIELIIDLSSEPEVINGSPMPGPIGRILADTRAYYNNFASFFTSEGHDYDGYSAFERQMLRSGFTSGNLSGTVNTTLGVNAFEDTLSADYAMDYFESYTSDYPEEYQRHYTSGLLGFNQAHAWDLSTATFTSSGTYCAEGDVDPMVSGCLDFDFSLMWENDASGPHASCRWTSNLMDCYGQPDDGLATLQAGDATASFAYTPGGTTFTFDAGDGSAVFQTTLPPIIAGPI